MDPKEVRFRDDRYNSRLGDEYAGVQLRESRREFFGTLSWQKRLRYNLTGVPSQGRRFTLKHFGWSRTLALIVLLAVVLWQVL